MDLLHFIRVLGKRKWLIVAVVMTAVVTTFLITRKLPKVYKSKAQLATGITEKTGPTPLSWSPQLQWFEIDGKFNNLIERIKSNQSIALLSYELILHDLEKTNPFKSLDVLRDKYTSEDLRKAATIYHNKLDSIQPLMSPGEVETIHVRILEDMAYDPQSLLDNFAIARDADTDYLGVTYSSDNPFLSAFAVNTLCKQFMRYHDAIRQEQADNAVEFYAKLAVDKRRKLDELMLAQQSMMINTGTVSFEKQAEAIVKQISDLESMRDREAAKIPGLVNNLDNITAKFDPNQESFIEAKTSKANSKILEIQTEMRRLTASQVDAMSSGRNYTGIADSLSELRNQLANQIASTSRIKAYSPEAARDNLVDKRIKAELDLGMARETVKEFDAKLDALRRRKAYMTGNKKGLDELDRDVEVATLEYQKVAQKLQEEKFNNNTASKISQVEWIQPSAQPEASKSMILVALAGIVSAALCVVVLFVLEYIDVSIKLPSNFERMTKLDLMGGLNMLESDKLDLVSLFMTTNPNVSLETYKQLLRKIRYEVVASNAKRFLITSTRAGTGKTSLLLSLAYSLSLNKKQVVLIDTNFKGNDLTHMCSADPTLEKYLSGELSRERLISSSGLDGVDVIGCEGGNYTPSEIFSYGDFNELLNDLAAKYDYIFMEGASLNTYSDAKELAEYADKVLPIFSARSSVKQPDRLSIEYLKSHNGKLMPAVLNKVGMDNLNE